MFSPGTFSRNWPLPHRVTLLHMSFKALSQDGVQPRLEAGRHLNTEFYVEHWLHELDCLCPSVQSLLWNEIPNEKPF